MSEKINSKLSIFEKGGYALGDTASCLIWNTISWYLLFFYTDVFGLEAAAAGFMIMLLRSLDAVVDPVVGMIADRTETKYGKFRPYLLWGAVPLVLMVILTFTTPDISYSGKLIYAYITYGAMMILYSVINIPYSAMLGVLTSDPVERTTLSSYKYVGAYLGGLVISAALLPMIKYVSPDNAAKGWQLAMIVLGAVAIILYVLTFFATKERVQPPKEQKTSVLKDLKDLVSNGPWVVLLFVSLSMILSVASRMNITTYYFKYYVGTQTFFGVEYGYEWLTSMFNTIGMIMSIVGVIAVSWVVKHVGKIRTFILYFIINLVLTGSFYFMNPHDVTIMFVVQAIASFVGGPLSTLIWAMYADTADYSEYKNGRRATGLAFSAAIMAQKFGWAIGAWFTGLLLTYFGFQANMAQNNNVQDVIRSLMSSIPVLFGIISVILVIFYKLNDKKMKEIESELVKRRE